MKDVNQTKQPNIFLITAESFHMTFSWILLWKSHFFFNWPLESQCSSIPLEIPYLPHPVTFLAWIFSGITHIVFGSHLKKVTRVLFSSSRAGLSIFKTANIGRLTFLLQFSRQKIHYKSTKNEGFQCAVTQVVLDKISWNKK